MLEMCTPPPLPPVVTRPPAAACNFVPHLQGSVAWGGKSTCDVLFNGDNNSYYPFRLMDIELACDCFIDTPTCNTGDFELRTRLGALLPQPIDGGFVFRGVFFIHVMPGAVIQDSCVQQLRGMLLPDNSER